MNIKVKEIAQIINGKVIGEEDLVIDSFSKIEEGIDRSISFLANPKYSHYLKTTGASAVIVDEAFDINYKEIRVTLIEVNNAYQGFAKILNHFSKDFSPEAGINQTAFIDLNTTLADGVFVGANVSIGKDCTIEENVLIYPNCHLGNNVTIGKNSVIYPGVSINQSCKIGKNCIIQSGAIIGSDGFGFANGDDDDLIKVAQIGNVIIQDNVEIGAGTTIDRATMGSTIIKEGAKLDNLIQIAHNVEIGRNTIIAAQTGIAGSTKIGENCMIGGQVGIVGHLLIGNNVKIAAQSGIGSNIKDNEVIQGSPAFSIGDYRKSYVSFKKLPQLFSLVYSLEKQLNNLLKTK